MNPIFNPSTRNTALALLATLSLAACGSSSSPASSGSSSSGGGSSGASSSSGAGSSSSSSGAGSSSSSGGSSSSSSGGSTVADAAGVYLGILENPAAGASNAMWGLIDSNHQGVFVDDGAHAVYRFGTLGVSGGKFSGGFVSYTPGSSGGASIGGGTVHSSYVAANSLTGYLAFSDAKLPAYSFSSSYQAALYAIPASFATIAGSYTFGSGNGALTVNTDGSFVASYSGCYTNGTLTIPDTAHNAYELSGAQVCGSATLPVTGLASYIPPGSATKAQLRFEYDDGKSIAVESAATSTR